MSEAMRRLIRKLEDALGSEVLSALYDPDVVEIMLNPDGQLFVERLGQEINHAGRLDRTAAEIVIGTVAHALNVEVSPRRPIVSGQLPLGNHRFEGLVPPVVVSPTFSIRKRASRLITLDDYLEAAAMTDRQLETIETAIAMKQNIVVCGGTGSGKTTFANAVISRIAAFEPDDRILILEDTPELQCAANNNVALRTTDMIDMAALLRSTLRLRPNRIVVGEVRDGAALTLLKAWNTGHPGGVTTVHANSPRSALQRLEQLTAEVSQQPMQPVIAEAVDLVISIERTPAGRKVGEIIVVHGFENGQYRIVGTAGEGARHAA